MQLILYSTLYGYIQTFIAKEREKVIDTEGFADFLYDNELSDNTVKAYIGSLKHYQNRYSSISKNSLREYKRELITRYKPSTVNRHITALMSYCKYQHLDVSLKLVKVPKLTHIENIITPEQIQILTDGLTGDGNVRWLVNIAMLSKTGMRVSEAVRITKHQVLAGKTDIYTKGKLRTVYFPDSLNCEISEWLGRIKDNDTVMQNKDGNPITVRGVQQQLQSFADRYGIPKDVMHPHSFRHYFAIEFLKRKNDISLLADILGHSSINVTQIYARQSELQQKQAVDEYVNW